MRRLHKLTRMLSSLQGNTGERSARNPAAYRDEDAARLYDETAKIVRQKVQEFDPQFEPL
jgi:hypothetical protein